MNYFALELQPDGRYSLDLGDMAANLISLEMSPESPEPTLIAGRWLILAFAIWSGPDRKAVSTAMHLAKSTGHPVRIAVRPFDSHSEFDRWCPAVKERFRSPVWLLLNNGELIAERVGYQSISQLQDLIDKTTTREQATG
jgi:hypothetical protein